MGKRIEKIHGQYYKRKSKNKKVIIAAIIALCLMGMAVAGIHMAGIPFKKNKDTTDISQKATAKKERVTDQTIGENKKPQTENKDEKKIEKSTDNTKIPDSADSIKDKTNNSRKKDTVNVRVSPAPDEETDMQETFKPDTDKRIPRKVKGIYVSGPMAGTATYMDELIDLVDTTELNAMVIDIKNDNGEITYDMDLPEAKELNANANYIGNMEELISKLKKKDIYLIARIVAFKDPVLAKGKPELSLKKKDGAIFYDKSGLSWVNPYKKEVWEYLVSVAKEAAIIGFDEIQFDYIRFSTDSGMKEVDFGEDGKNKSKIEVITDFTKYACENLKPLGVYVSADVYGTIIDSKVDAEIVGQDYKEMAKYLDYICPMIYPSHYQNGSYGIDYPDLKPYDLILNALNKSRTVLGEDKNKTAVVRSWLQDFTATWLNPHKIYGADEIRAQIQAVYDAGYEEWILWNGSNNYTKEGLKKE